MPGRAAARSQRANIFAVDADKNAIASNLARIRERVARAAERSGRRPDDVTVIAVSKTFSADAIRDAYDLGLSHFGENRVQEWDSKRESLSDLAATFHLIGHLQGNKARRATEIFDTIDSVDSPALARKLDAAWAEKHQDAASQLPVRSAKCTTAPSGVASAEPPAKISR